MAEVGGGGDKSEIRICGDSPQDFLIFGYVFRNPGGIGICPGLREGIGIRRSQDMVVRGSNCIEGCKNVTFSVNGRKKKRENAYP